jgi:excisionase family DNA binding protein
VPPAREVLPRDLLTIDDVADMLDVHPNSVRKWCKSGKLHSIRVGRRFRIAPSALDSFLRDGADTPAGGAA